MNKIRNLKPLKDNEKEVKCIKKEQFDCDLCSKVFNNYSNLIAHVNTVHEKIKKFKCELCNKHFDSSQKVKRHVVSVHEKIRAFICKACNRTFSDNGNLLQHERTVHNKSKVKCDTCSAILKNVLTLKGHVKRVHKKEKNYECKVCYKRFNGNSMLTDQGPTTK